MTHKRRLRHWWRVNGMRKITCGGLSSLANQTVTKAWKGETSSLHTLPNLSPAHFFSAQDSFSYAGYWVTSVIGFRNRSGHSWAGQQVSPRVSEERKEWCQGGTSTEMAAAQTAYPALTPASSWGPSIASSQGALACKPCNDNPIHKVGSLNKDQPQGGLLNRVWG